MTAWGGLNRTHCLSANVLSTLSSYIHSIRHAMSSNAEIVMLDNVEAHIGTTPVLAGSNTLPFALLCTMPGPSCMAKLSGYQRMHMDMFVRDSTRRVALPPASLAAVLEAAFRCEQPPIS
jgi:hypothetical protein